MRLVVPFPAGGGTDAFARPLAAALSQQTGQQFFIDNRGGAGGTIGADVVAKSPADGYTFLVGAVHHTIAVNVYKSLPYQLEKDLAPVTLIAIVPNVVVLHPKVPINSVKELIAYAKANPDKLNYGSAGNGTSHHLAPELFKIATETKINHVPYKGAGPGDAGPDRGTSRSHVRRHGQQRAADPRRTAEGARRDHPDALSRHFPTSRHCRSSAFPTTR